MANSTGIVLTVGAITAVNEVIFAPMAHTGTVKDFNWRILPATAGLAFGLAGLEKIAPLFAVGLAWLSLVAAITIPFGNAPTPVDNFLSVMGYNSNKKGWQGR